MPSIVYEPLGTLPSSFQLSFFNTNTSLLSITMSDFLTETRAEGADFLNAFREHANAPRVETKTVVLSGIRATHPDHHVTEVEEKKVSLFEYAAAGKAKCILDVGDEGFMATKAWKSVGEGVGKKEHPGELKDEFRYARYVVLNSFSPC